MSQQRSAIDRIGDLVKTVLWTALFVYNVAWCAQLGYFGFFTNKPIWIGDQLISLVLVVWAGWFGFVEWRNLRKHRTGSWFFINLGHVCRGAFIRISCWWLDRQVKFLNWVFHRWYGEDTLNIVLATVEPEEQTPTPSAYDDDIIRQSMTTDEYDVYLSPHNVATTPASITRIHPRADEWHDEFI